MKEILLVLALAAPARSQEAHVVADPGAQVLQPPQILDLSAVEGLVAVGAQDLAGVFGFIPEAAVTSAFADYLLHSRKALKKFLKKGERDLKELGGINAWDKAVWMSLMQINGAGLLPLGMNRLDKDQELRVSALVLARGLSLQEMTAIRGAKQ